MQFLASDLQRMDIAQLDPETLGNNKKLSSHLAQICSSIRTHKGEDSRAGQGQQGPQQQHRHVSSLPPPPPIGVLNGALESFT